VRKEEGRREGGKEGRREGGKEGRREGGKKGREGSEGEPTIKENLYPMHILGPKPKGR
jgi:hypothetical protein